MNPIESALRRIAVELDTRQVGWALAGGFAVSARTEPRFTRDVDVVVLVGSDAAAEDLVRSLVQVGYRLGTVVEQDDVGVLATVRLISPGAPGTVVVDLLFATAGIEPETVSGAEILEILPGVRMPVATAGHLVALKLLSRDDRTRPQDAADLRALQSVLGPHERETARIAVALIERRGFARGRRLTELLTEFLASSSAAMGEDTP